MRFESLLMTVALTGVATGLAGAQDPTAPQAEVGQPMSGDGPLTVDRVRSLLADPAVDLQAADPQGVTLLHRAAMTADDPEVLTLLLEARANAKAAGSDAVALHPADSHGARPIHWAAANPNPAITELLLEWGADPDESAGASGWTPLHHAARTNTNPAVIRLLIEHGAGTERTVRASPSSQRLFQASTPAQFAASTNENIEVMKVLLETATEENPTDLIKAASSNRNRRVLETIVEHAASKDPEIFSKDHVFEFFLAERRAWQVGMLIEAGADVNALIRANNGANVFLSQPQAGARPLALAANARTDAMPKIELLLAAGAEPVLEDRSGNDVLGAVVSTRSYNADAKILSRLIEAGASTAHTNQSGESALHGILKNYPKPEHVELLLKAGADPGLADEKAVTPLHLVVTLNRYEVVESDRTALVRLLLEHGADQNARRSSGQSVLDQALSLQSEDVVALLLERNAVGHDNLTTRTLVKRCEDGNVDSQELQSLIDRHANVNGTSRNLNALTLLIINGGSADAVGTMIRAGADLNPLQRTTPLAAARMNDRPDLEAMLVDKGARNTHQTVTMPNGKTLGYNLERMDGTESTVTREEIAAYLQAHPEFDLNQPIRTSGMTILNQAAMQKDPELIEIFLAAGAEFGSSVNLIQGLVGSAMIPPEFLAYLIDRGVDLDSTDGSGLTLLHSAARYQGPEILELLIERGLDPSATTESGQTPLHFAAESNSNIASCLVLLEAGADVNAADDARITPLHAAATPEYMNVSNLGVLVEHGADLEAKDEQGRTALHRAVAKKNAVQIKMVARLIELGADVNAADQDGRTPLFQVEGVLGKPNIEMADALLAAGADLEVRDQAGDTLLLWSTGNRYRMKKNWDMAHWLIRAKADPVATGRAGNTALHQMAQNLSRQSSSMSSWKEDLSILRLLANTGEALHVNNGAGRTPLGETAYLLGFKRHQDASKIGSDRALLAVLIDAGADVNATAIDGQTPYQQLTFASGRFADEGNLLADYLVERGAHPLPPMLRQNESPFLTAEAAVRAERDERVTIVDE